MRRERRSRTARPRRSALSVVSAWSPPVGSCGGPSSSPHLVGDLDDHAKLRPLLLLGEDIAFLGRGKAALGREAQLLDIDVFGRFVDAALDRVLLLQCAALRGDEAEHHLLLPLGHEPQRPEAAGAVGVVFEEIAVDIDLAEQTLGDELIAALGDEGGAEIAAAGMHGHDHIGGTAGQCQVRHLRIVRGQTIGIVAARLGMLALLRIADHRPGGVVELQVAAAGVVEGADGLAIGHAHVVEVAVEIGVDLLADGLPALAEMQRRGRRDRHLGRDLGVVLDEAEMLEVRMAGEIDLADHAHALGLGLDAGEGDALAGGVELDPVEPLVEVELPPSAAELAIGRKLEPDLLLLLDDLLDLAILDRLELGGGDLTLLALPSRLLERRGAQEAADVIGAERRFGSRRHGSHLPQTSPASSLIMRSFAHCSSSASTLPSSVEAKPHCGESANCSSGANLAASSMRRLTASFFSSVPLLEVTRPSTTILLPLGRCRSGSKPPARSLSYSRK